MVPAILGVNHVTLCVSELGRSIAFYVDTLGARLRARWKRGAYLEWGSVWLCLEVSTRVTPRDDDSHLALGVDAATLAEVAARGITTWKENRSEGDSLYFLDPDGHKLELHVGDLESRLASCRARPYDEMEFFDP